MDWTPPSWIRDRAVYRFPRIEPSRTALLAIDLQRGFIDPGYPLTIPGAEVVVSRTNELSRCVRSAGGQVIYTRHSQTTEGEERLSDWQYQIPGLMAMSCFEPGAIGHSLHPDVEISEGDLVFDKFRYSAFRHADVDLADYLRTLQIDTLVITGVATNVCCETTARDASMLGFKTFVASDCVATVSAQEHDASLTNLSLIFADVRSYREIMALLTEGQSDGK